jgi:3-oxoacyl-[acyl-carrier protein] reductase
MSDREDRSLEGRVALVTGASRGLGRAISVALGRRRAFVGINYLQNHKEAERTLSEVRSSGGDGALYPTDVRDQRQVAEMFHALLSVRSRVHILVNNAGIRRDEHFVMMRQPNWQAVIETDLDSAFYCSKAVVRQMCAARQGVIISIGSGSGLSPRPGQVNYSSAKSALIGYSRSLAREVARNGVRVNVVAPGFTHTSMSEMLPHDVIEESIRKIPLGRWATPDEVAEVVCWVASDEAAFLTGQTLVVDGGRAAVEQDFGY